MVYITIFIVFPPIGIFFLWKNKKFGKVLRTGLTIFSALIFMTAITPINYDNSLMLIYSNLWLYKYMDDRDKDGVVGE